MELKGKIMNVLGDSITEGIGCSSIDKIYCNLLKDRLGLAEVRNYGDAGKRFAAQMEEDGTWNDHRNFYDLAKKMDPNADIVVVFGATNDFGHGNAPLGTFEDRDTHSFYGACHVLMRYLIEKYPEAVIVFMTPLHRDHELEYHGDGRKAEVSAPLLGYVNAIRETAEYYALPVLDLYSMSGIQPNIPIMQEKYCPDQLHPNDAGHARIADRLEWFLKSY